MYLLALVVSAHRSEAGSWPSRAALGGVVGPVRPKDRGSRVHGVLGEARWARGLGWAGAGV